MRTVVSVSMDPEMATRLKSSAAERGLSFSARVCELVDSGELHEVLVDGMERDPGLFARTEVDSAEQESGESTERSMSSAPAEQTQSDDALLLRPEGGEKSGAESSPPDTGSESESSLPSDRSDVIESGNEDQPDSRREPVGTVAERVYACVTAEKTKVKDIAERADVSEIEAGEVLERLIDQDGEPIIMTRVAGEWVCWLEAA